MCGDVPEWRRTRGPVPAIEELDGGYRLRHFDGLQIATRLEALPPAEKRQSEGS